MQSFDFYWFGFELFFGFFYVCKVFITFQSDSMTSPFVLWTDEFLLVTTV